MNVDYLTLRKRLIVFISGVSLLGAVLAFYSGDMSTVSFNLILITLQLSQWNAPHPAEVYEKKVAVLRAKGIYPQAGEETDADVYNLYRNKRRIFAIKLYMDMHGVGLKEAKAEVERMAAVAR
ncbi:hypothetical protein EON80_25755 [bacterium]|nr:MAG: hypothetical protein EON80_25755 [bacterium]